ncbi:MAG: hypothetical protein LBI38_07015 [Oscillospiraceae bacterium]|nr:hypothetical protein [Oscillospiraceae bacterium]
MKKVLSLLLTAAVLLPTAACSSDKNGGEFGALKDGDVRAAVGAEATVDGGAAEAPAEADGRDGEAALIEDALIEDAWDMVAGGAAEAPKADDGDRGGQEEPVPYGLLTGGEWNDNANWDFWGDLIKNNPEWASLASKWRINPSERITVKVTGGGEPVRDAQVALFGGDGEPLWRARTDHNGIAYLFGETDPQSQSRTSEKRAEVSANGVTASKTVDSDYIEIELTGAVSPAKTLDLMLVCDTTGSMSDELDYLQRELESVVNAVNRDNIGVPVRLSVNFYRDEGDDYVVLPYEFTDDIKAAVNVLKKQSAGGGGDYPEAVDAALLNAVYEHDWERGSVKIILFVLDAPPHYNSETAANMGKIIAGAADDGVRIIPVAASGVDKETEFLLRCLSITTGGTYTFLTDHSGIGDGHVEPTIGAYEVEKLNEMLIRIIGEYLG